MLFTKNLYNLKKIPDPYQILFPIGLLHAFLGAATWILYPFKLIEYPGQLHSHYMFIGFLLSFACGFLLTAVPRFTGTKPCSWLELFIATSLCLVSLIISSPVMGLAILLFITYFFIRRLATKEYPPPPHFIFLPIGLVLGISGTTLMTLAQWHVLDTSFLITGRLFLFYGSMLAFLLGIGAKLISALLGWTTPPTHRIEPLNTINQTSALELFKWTVPFIQAFLFLLGFVLEILSYPVIGRALRAFCATWIATQNWKLYHLPKAQGKLPFWIWIAAWTLLMGLWTHALFPSLGIHAAHLIFIGGLGLITLLVASRVTLAHGGYPLDLESKSRIFMFTGIFILLAMLTRVLAPWSPSYFPHLAYAAIAWIIALFAWSAFFLPKIIFHYKR